MIYVFDDRWLVESAWFTFRVTAYWLNQRGLRLLWQLGDWLDQRGLRFWWEVTGWISVVYVSGDRWLVGSAWFTFLVTGDWLDRMPNLVHKVIMSALTIGACFYCPAENSALFNPWRVLKDRVCFGFKVWLRFLIYVHVSAREYPVWLTWREKFSY